MPSKYTIELCKSVSATLPLEDKRDFEEAKKGFIAKPLYKNIMADAGNVGARRGPGDADRELARLSGHQR